MKSFTPPTTAPQSLPMAAMPSEHSIAVIAPTLQQAKPLHAAVKKAEEVSQNTLLTMPTVWLWHGNLVIFGAHLTGKLKVEERLATHDRAGLMIKPAEYVIEAPYTQGSQLGRLTWHLACDWVTTRSIFFLGEKGQDSFWFIPSVNSRTRIINNQSPQADTLTPPWVTAPAGRNAATVAHGEGNGDLGAEHFCTDEVAATYAILLYLQAANLPKAVQLFERLALDAEQLHPQFEPVGHHSKAPTVANAWSATVKSNPLHAKAANANLAAEPKVTLKKSRIADEVARLPIRTIR